MKYADWIQAFVTKTREEPERCAQLWNLQHEIRINKERGQFKRAIARNYGNNPDRERPDSEAAVHAFDAAVRDTKSVDNEWLGLLPSPDTSSVPDRLETYVSSSAAERWGRDVLPADHGPLPQLSSLPLPTRREGGARVLDKRFIWGTFQINGRSLPRDDPRTIARELGLAHCRGEREYLYRFELPLPPEAPTFTPTALDAGVDAAWKPPPPNFPHPWGLTRDLVDGQSKWPELLVEAAGFFNTPQRGDIVSPAGSAAVPVGRLDADYMIGR